MYYASIKFSLLLNLLNTLPASILLSTKILAFLTILLAKSKCLLAFFKGLLANFTIDPPGYRVGYLQTVPYNGILPKSGNRYLRSRKLPLIGKSAARRSRLVVCIHSNLKNSRHCAFVIE